MEDVEKNAGNVSNKRLTFYSFLLNWFGKVKLKTNQLITESLKSVQRKLTVQFQANGLKKF